MVLIAASSIASPFMRIDREAASSSRAWPSTVSRSARTRSSRKLKGGRITPGLVGRLDGGLTVAGHLFDVLVLVVERFDAQRPLAVDQNHPPGAEVAAVHEQLRGLVRLAVEVHDRALGHP